MTLQSLAHDLRIDLLWIGAKKYRRMQKMKEHTRRITIRLTDDQFEKLNFYSEKMGYSTSELIREMIDHADDVTMQQNLGMTDKKIEAELKKTTELKYQNYLFSNLTKNMNQIAHYINKYKGNARVKSLASAFQIIEKHVGEIKNELRGKGADQNGNNQSKSN